MDRKSLGSLGESLAKLYLENLGYETLHTNWRYGRYGEIDIIAYLRSKQQLSFVEVKTRRTQSFGTPLESVTPTKQHKIRQVAEAYLATHPIPFPFQNVSFDVLAITPHPTQQGEPLIEFYEGAF